MNVLKPYNQPLIIVEQIILGRIYKQAYEAPVISLFHYRANTFSPYITNSGTAIESSLAKCMKQTLSNSIKCHILSPNFQKGQRKRKVKQKSYQLGGLDDM